MQKAEFTHFMRQKIRKHATVVCHPRSKAGPTLLRVWWTLAGHADIVRRAPARPEERWDMMTDEMVTTWCNIAERKANRLFCDENDKVYFLVN